jgi:DNA polymerase I
LKTSSKYGVARSASLFTREIPPPDDGGWTPRTDWPSLAGFDEIGFDVESTGLKWWKGDRAIGYSIGLPNGDAFYLPTGHRAKNLDPDKVHAYLRAELRGKTLVGVNNKFDTHMSRVSGLDLEALGCKLKDMAHVAALLDDHRREFSLEALAQSELGRGKVKGLDVTKLAEYSAGSVAPYAEEDVRLPLALNERYKPLIAQQELERVLDLECRATWPTIEMEKNGALIDVDLLDRWVVESEQTYLRLLWEVNREIGHRVDPSRYEDMVDLFKKLEIPLEHTTPSGKQFSFKDEVLAGVAHPVVQKIRYATKIASLRSKYLLKFAASVDRATGRLAFALHQLRGDEGGTITGRYSASGIDGEGHNPQQVLTPAKQRELYGYEDDDASHDDEIFVIRKLYRAAPGRKVISADAKQVEFRIFAHYANSKRILDEYAKDPNVSFHLLVWEIAKKSVPDIRYKPLKNTNFAKLYGAGVKQIALMTGLTEQEARPFVAEYDRFLPEVSKLLSQASNAAAVNKFVKTMAGRRARFPDGQFLHKALNSIIQGGASEINKEKACELHASRHETGFLLRLTVHDEFVGDGDAEVAEKVRAILDRQSFPHLRVPILWDVNVGDNWAEC